MSHNRKAAVLGSPVAHSLSPALHSAAYRKRGLDDWHYEAVELDEAALPGFFEHVGGPEEQGWAGFSVTMPLKRAVIPLLDSISDTAAWVEAVNTVVLTDDGRRLGDNTDIPGMVGGRRAAGGAAAGGRGRR